jgi:cytochrome c553
MGSFSGVPDHRRPGRVYSCSPSPAQLSLGEQTQVLLQERIIEYYFESKASTWTPIIGQEIVMRKLLVAASVCAFTVVGSAAQAAGDPAAGKAKSGSCAACHGGDGNSPNPQWPKLAGQHAEYMVLQLKAFKAGERKNPLMSPMAAPLSEADMEDLSAYFASQTPK